MGKKKHTERKRALISEEKDKEEIERVTSKYRSAKKKRPIV